MVELAEIQAAYYMVAATGVLIAAIYYVMTLRATQRNMRHTLETRQAQILMNLYQSWQELDFQDAFMDILTWEWRDYDDFQEKYGRSTNPSEYRKSTLIGVFFEGLGVFVKRGFIDPTLVDDMMSSYIVAYWQKLGPIFKEARSRLNSPTVMEHAEYLYDVIYEIWKKQHPETLRPFGSP